ncbi:cell division protein FtsZ, partial [Candidatus Altiarchaeota archaeon]
MDSIVNSALQHGPTDIQAQEEFQDTDTLKIVVLGTGGAGNNTVNRLEHIGVEGAHLVAANTDKQDLSKIEGNITKI